MAIKICAKSAGFARSAGNIFKRNLAPADLANSARERELNLNDTNLCTKCKTKFTAFTNFTINPYFPALSLDKLFANGKT